jgi:hypothetical protein
VPFAHPKVNPAIIVRNKNGKPLRQRGAFSSAPEDPIESTKFKQAMRGVTTSITIAGTPESVELYFPLKLRTVESEFTATAKPEVIFGELKSPITKTRYEKPLRESELKIVTKEQVRKGINISFHEETYWDKTRQRYFKVDLPDVANSFFARPNFKNLQVTFQGKELDVEPMPNNINRIYNVTFYENTEDGSGKVMNFDHIEGVLRIKYPARFKVFKVSQNETRNDVHLDGAFLTYPDGDIPYYSNVFNTRSVIAYGKNNRQISLLDNSSIWQKGNKLIFWGRPEYVDVKKVVEWIDIEVPVNLGLKDLQIDKSLYGMN